MPRTKYRARKPSAIWALEFRSAIESVRLQFATYQ
jgi:hypothetical protein